uniref:Uncharacterized protein n=1 Tax=Rhizophora mucronata TaxID=61149 RepID=A0A2P2JYI3_RHIMU
MAFQINVTFFSLSAFDDMNQENSDANYSSGMVSSLLFHTNSDISVLVGSSMIALGHGNDSQEEISELGSPRHERKYSLDLGMNSSTSELNINDLMETSAKDDKLNPKNILGNLDRFSWRKMLAGREKGVTGKDKLAKTMPKEQDFIGDGTKSLPEPKYLGLDGQVRTLSTDNGGSDLSSVRAGEVSNLGMNELLGDDSFDLSEGAQTPRSDVAVSSDLHFPKDLLVTLPVEQRHKLSRVLNTIRQRLNTAKTDMEDLIARLNQEIAVRQFLTTKVKDLEVDLETTRTNCKENMQQAVTTERERFTQMQWDVGDLQRKCLEMELKLNHEQDEKARAESARASLMQENEMLLHQLDLSREELATLHRDHEELELKSKADVKLLVKEVKSLRSSQSELKQDLGRLMKEKLEVEHVLQKEKQRMEHVTTANSKLLHECEILRNRLQECSVSFLIEEEDKLIVETSSPSDAIDILTTSDNRIGLLLAEAQLLAQDIQSSDARSDETCNTNDINGSNNELGKMLTDIFVDNARLRMQVNSVIRYVLHKNVNSDKEEEEEESPLRRTVLSKFL